MTLNLRKNKFRQEAFGGGETIWEYAPCLNLF